MEDHWGYQQNFTFTSQLLQMYSSFLTNVGKHFWINTTQGRGSITAVLLFSIFDTEEAS